MNETERIGLWIKISFLTSLVAAFFIYQYLKPRTFIDTPLPQTVVSPPEEDLYPIQPHDVKG